MVVTRYRVEHPRDEAYWNADWNEWVLHVEDATEYVTLVEAVIDADIVDGSIVQFETWKKYGGLNG